MDTAVNRPELLLVADAVAREKQIERDDVLEAMEQAIQKAGRAKYGHEKDIRATIDRKTGDVRLSRWLEAGRWKFFGFYCLLAAAGVLLIHFKVK